MAAIPDQGRAEGADGVGSEAGDVLPEDGGGRPGPAGALGGGPQCPGPGRGQVFREQRTSRDPVGDVAEGGVQPLAGGACFEDEKTELGFDHYEGRNYTGLLRHQLVTAVSHLFLARVQRAERGEKSGPDGVSGADRDGGGGPRVGARGGRAEVLRERAAEQIRWTQQQNAKARASHTKRTIRTLHAAGIRLADLKNCYRGSS